MNDYLQFCFGSPCRITFVVWLLFSSKKNEISKLKEEAYKADNGTQEQRFNYNSFVRGISARKGYAAKGFKANGSSLAYDVVTKKPFC